MRHHASEGTYRLTAWAVYEIKGVSHTQDEYEVEQEPDYVGECRGICNGLGYDPGGVFRFLGDPVLAVNIASHPIAIPKVLTEQYCQRSS